MLQSDRNAFLGPPTRTRTYTSPILCAQLINRDPNFLCLSSVAEVLCLITEATGTHFFMTRNYKLQQLNNKAKLDTMILKSLKESK